MLCIELVFVAALLETLGEIVSDVFKWIRQMFVVTVPSLSDGLSAKGEVPSVKIITSQYYGAFVAAMKANGFVDRKPRRCQ